jgi:hypothetical protein
LTIFGGLLPAHSHGMAPYLLTLRSLDDERRSVMKSQDADKQLR